jgi:UDP-glucuronate decarboxylase
MQSPEGFTGPVNLGNPEEYTVLELAQLIIKLTGSRSMIINKGLPKDDPERRKPDISFAKTTLGWLPKIKLEEGLMKTIDYFDTLLRSTSVSKK